jgi:methylmalonyl-CoA/ethylmalonyl-CoA epimerase
MITRLHHLTFVVRDLDAAEEQYRNALGIEPLARESLPQRGVVSSRFKVGDVWIALVQPVAEGIPARHLRERGEGLLLVSYEVPDLGQALAACALRGIVPDGPRRTGVADWNIVDLATTATPGAVTQLCQATT